MKTNLAKHLIRAGDRFLSHLLRYLFLYQIVEKEKKKSHFWSQFLVPQGKLILNQSLQWFDPEIVSRAEQQISLISRGAVGKELWRKKMLQMWEKLTWPAKRSNPREQCGYCFDTLKKSHHNSALQWFFEITITINRSNLIFIAFFSNFTVNSFEYGLNFLFSLYRLSARGHNH